MSITAFLTELRRELTRAEPDFIEWLAVLKNPQSPDELFMSALEAYGAQIDRVGLTATMLGMHGLAQWAGHLNAGLISISAASADDRDMACMHLADWPMLVDQYLSDPSQLESALLLTDYLASPRSMQPLDDAHSMALIELLSAPPEIPEELLAEFTAAAEPAMISEADVSLAPPDDMDVDVYRAFIDEAPAKLEEFARYTHAIARGQSSADDIRNAKLIAHSFKGSANIVGIRGIAALGHHTEDVLEYFEQHPVAPSRALGRTLVDASDCLSQMVAHLQGDEAEPANAFAVLTAVVAWANKVKSGDIEDMSAADDVPATQSTLPASAASAGISSVTSSSPLTTKAAPVSAAVAVADDASLRVPIRTVDELFRLVGELTTKISRLEDRVTAVGRHAKGLLQHHGIVQKRVVDLEKLVMLRGLSWALPLASAGGETDQTFDPLEMDHYNELHGATRTLVEATDDARELACTVEGEIAVISAEMSQHVQVGRDLQHQIISTRMTPVSSLFGRLTRNVRQTCQQTGKEAELVMSGGDILVDGDVLNKLADPLLHVLRNAVDHGIEAPDARLTAGKTLSGTIHLDFSRQGSSITVLIRDDGRGLDLPRIREKAIERGLVPADAAFSDDELASLTLLPGFSTRDAVSEISGRGVGMDVVNSRLKELKGAVELHSKAGYGCDVILRFQASLVTQQCLLVDDTGQIFALPIHDVVQGLAPGLGEVMANGDSWEIMLGTERYPIHTLAALTGNRMAAPSSGQREVLASMPAVLMRVGNAVMAVLVNQVLSTRNLIVKPLGRCLPKVHGIIGTSLLGDGTVVPLLNIPELLHRPMVASHAADELADAARRRVRRVLVVDDSLSVRKSLTQLLQDSAYEVQGAGDGLEAIRALDLFDAQVICTDLEMPNMNGLELTEYLRRDPRTAHLPIIMITSRSMDKHRDQASRAGVTHYLTKPYTNADLLHTVHQVLAAATSPETEKVAS